MGAELILTTASMVVVSGVYAGRRRIPQNAIENRPPRGVYDARRRLGTQPRRNNVPSLAGLD